MPDKNRKLIDEFKALGAPAASPRPRATKVSQFEKDFRDYLAAQQEARQQMVKDIAAGFAAAPLGYLAQIPLGIPDLASLVLPDAITENQFYPSTENAIKHAANAARNIPGLSDYADTMEAGMEAGQYAAIPQAIMAVPGMVKAVGRGAKAVGKEAGRRIDEAMMTGEGMLGKALSPARPAFAVNPKGQQATQFKAPQDEALRLAQQRAALPVEQGGLGLPKNNTSEQRAKAMGFVDDSYHGSLYDIQKFNLNKASTESAAGQGVYSTSSPKDASINYANVYGPDVEAKINRYMDAGEKDWRRIHKRLSDGTLTPRQKEILLGHTLNAQNTGVVYPLKIRSDKSIHLDAPEKNPVQVGPFERYDEALDQYVDTPHTGTFNRALDEYSNLGGETNAIREAASDLGGGEAVNARDLFNAIKKEKYGLFDPDAGEYVSGGVAAGNFLRHFGIDEIRHTPEFGRAQLNIAKEHRIGLNPDNIRSRFAAFDPFRRNAATAAAMGVAAPDLLAEENKANGGTVSQDAMQIKAWDKAIGGKVERMSGGGIKSLINVGKGAKKVVDVITDLRAAPKVGVASPLAMRSAADKAEEALQKMQAFKSLKGQDRQRAIDSVRAKAERSGIPRTKADLNAATAGEEDIARSMLNSPAYKIANVVPKATVNKALETRQMYRAEPPTTPGPNASEKEWADWGASHGVNMTVTTPESLGISDLTSRREAMIPGGLKGTFTIPDLFWMKANNFNPAALPQDVHTELMKKFIRTNKISSPDEVDVFNRLNFALLSPNAPLTPNEFLAQRARLRTPEELSALAGRVGEEGLNRTAATQLGVGQAGSGGMGVLGTADLSSQAMLAKLIKDKPSMFQMAPGETMRDVTIRVMNQAPGLGPKTASLGTPWLDLEKANTSAVDLHMIRDAYPMLLHDPIVGDAFRERMAALLKTKPTAAAILSKPEKDVRDAAIAIVGGTDMSRLYRLKSGELNRIPDVATPDKLAYEPKSFSEFNPFYSRVVDYVDQSRGANPDIELFPEQWRKWDVLRQRIEPHEFAHPDYRKLPRQSFSEMQDALTAHKEAGYTQSSNPTMNLSDWRKLYYGRAVPEILAPTAAAGAAAAAAQTLLSDDSEKARGGAVNMAEGGMTSDDLIVEERPL